MGNDTAFWGRPSTSPFSPDFGASPPVLVGRRHEMAELGSGLATGPRDARYTSVLMGVRGSGKTALLNEMQDQAAAEGWVVLAVDASTPGLLDRIVSAVDRADQTYETLGVGPGDEKSVQRSVALRLGVLAGKLTTTRHPRERHPQDLRERLTLVAMAAERHGTSLLLTVDELHAVDRTEGRRLASDLQHITKREQLPLACVGAGLSEMKNTLMLDRKMTFFHRCETYDLAWRDASPDRPRRRVPRGAPERRRRRHGAHSGCNSCPYGGKWRGLMDDHVDRWGSCCASDRARWAKSLVSAVAASVP